MKGQYSMCNEQNSHTVTDQWGLRSDVVGASLNLHLPSVLTVK